jgi:pilus assembly protein Flp/PilA
MRKMLNWFASEESGQGMVEYGLILVLVSVVVVAVLTAMGGGLQGIFQKVNKALGGS